jgi:hypothetical protein
MKRINLLLIALVFAPVFSYAQLAINTTGQEATASAMLEISSNDKGILIPKMVISDVNSNTSPITNPADGLLIYNTGSVDVSEGFYYWSGLRWNKMTNDLSVLTTAQTSQLYETAELYENKIFATPTNISLTSNANFYGWITALAGETFGNTTTIIDDATADKIVIGEDGLYEIELSMSFGGSNNTQVRCAVFKTPNGGSTATQTRVGLLRKIASTGDLGSAGSHGLLRLDAGDKLDVRFNSASNNETLSIYSINFIVNKVGD